MNEQELKSKLSHYRLNSQEYERIEKILGREPQGVEWALFSALWSEHCSYKSSKNHLKKFYSSNSRVKESFGENAGVIDLGEGESVAFKMESHNHPSFISPHQGAATGVGGILRDIFTMGARPIMLGNYLCFGDPEQKHMPGLVDGVVRGIADYGNCVGVPMLTGQTEFNSSYNGNILVNAFALGYLGPGESIATSGAHGVGNYVVYVGAKTGRDGVHGASMASESFDDDSESKKPTIQIGDPFFEKLLIESCLDVIQQGLVEAIQDMGAAGLTSSSFEMAAKGDVGLRINLDTVPLRATDITPEEILLSESQERMLLICKPEKFDALKSVFSKWDLDAEVVGEVIDEQKVELLWHNEMLCSIDPKMIVDGAPVYNRSYQAWDSPCKVDELTELHISDSNKLLLECLAGVGGGSKDWIFNQYDQRVLGSTARDCSESVGVVRLKHSERALGVVLGCRPYVMRADAEIGGADAVLYPSVQLAAKGFEPLAVTDCLNFGNPEKPEVMGEFVAAVESMSKACESIDTPVISGNVSFYNETFDKNVTSTPSTGVVGLRAKLQDIPKDQFQQPENHLYLFTFKHIEMLGKVIETLHRGAQWTGEFKHNLLAQQIGQLTELVNSVKIESSKVVGKYGLAYTLARMSTDQIGVCVQAEDLTESDLFTEKLYQVVLEVSGANKKVFEEYIDEVTIEGCDIKLIGRTHKGEFKVADFISLQLKELQNAYNSSWENHFETLA